MARQITQSAIREVRDQLMLDTADGSYLNIVTSNLGLDRPKFGLSDDEWRAIAKVIGLHYKQIRTKFEEILAIIYGPKITLIGSLKTQIVAGDSILYLHSTEGIPQVGTLIIDRGLLTEETIPYSMIDRTNNAILLDNVVTYGHASVPSDVEKPLLLDRSAGSTVLHVGSVDTYPSSFPFSLLVGRGTPQEETVSVTAKDLVARTLTISPLANAQTGTVPSSVFTKVHSDYVNNTYLISARDIASFPESGEVLFAEPPIYTTVIGTTTTVTIPGGSVIADQLIGRKIIFHGNVTSALSNVVSTVIDNTDNTITFTAVGTAPVAGDSFYVIDAFAASAGTVSSVTVAASSFTNKELSAYKVVFVGNVTSALAGKSVNVETNTTTSMTFATALGTAPAAGDYFYILPRIEYSRASYDENVLVLKRPIYADIPRDMKIELLKRNSNTGLGQVQILGAGWEVFQVDPKNVEIILPADIGDENTIRTASYIHDKLISLASTTLSSPAAAGATSLTLTTLSGWPMQGVVTVNGVYRFGYGRRIVQDKFSSMGANTRTINLTTGGLTVNSLVGQDVIVGGNWSGTVESNTASSITFEQIIPNNIINSLSSLSVVLYVHPFIIDLLHEVVPLGGFASGVSASLYQPVYPATDLISGNFRSVPDTYPGPYLYSSHLDAPTNLQNDIIVAQNLAGPTKLVVSRNILHTALEVENASFFPLTGFPYSANLGGTSGNTEVVEITGISLRQQVGTGVTVNAICPIGATTLVLTTTGGTQNAVFPQANGYRVLVNRGQVNEEIVWITGVASATNLNCDPLLFQHVAGETVELLADVVVVSSITKSHTGYISEAQKKTRWPSISSTDRNNAETISVMYSSILLNSTTGLDVTGDSIILNFGKGLVDVVSKVANTPDIPTGSTTFIVPDSSVFPQPWSGGYPIILGEGTTREEIVFVTVNDTGLDQLTISKPTKAIHYFGERIRFVSGNEETIQYSSTSGNTLSFSSPVMLQSNHHNTTPAIGSELKSIPKSNGFDFPFRMPSNLFDQLLTLFDMVRAAGVQVTIIEQR